MILGGSPMPSVNLLLFSNQYYDKSTERKVSKPNVKYNKFGIYSVELDFIKGKKEDKKIKKYFLKNINPEEVREKIGNPTFNSFIKENYDYFCGCDQYKIKVRLNRRTIFNLEGVILHD